MTIATALQEWKALATTADEVSRKQHELANLESGYAAAQESFHQVLDDLDEAEREAILAVMSVYEARSSLNNPTASPASAAPSESDEQAKALDWLLNKVGNEGQSGVRFNEVAAAWESQYPNLPARFLVTTVNQHADLFTSAQDGNGNVLRLTAEGQSRFLNQ